ncbi:MAG: hypothetical protein NC124_19600 [Clostridium sp.]|nr:hypothetical protein [Ruminococcus flavefaciens]MCM1500673.1 hypothetical protein [Clostridium sp.]
MVEVIELFKNIQQTGSLNDKKAIITANKNNDLFKECLKFLLDGNVTTGIAEKKYNSITVKTSDWVHNDINKEFLELLNYIKQHNTGREEDIIQIQAWCYEMSDEVKDFVRGMITKNIKLGADAKLVNKCIPGLIPTFDVMLGTPIDKVKLKNDEWISISRKLNGCRAAFVGDKIMTRQGKEYKGLDHIVADLHRLGLKNWFVDGELLYKNKEGLSDSEAFQKGTGIAMSKDSDKSDLKLVVFDMFPLQEFWTGESKESYYERKQMLLEINEEIDLYNDVKNVEVVEMCYEGTDHTEIWKWLDYAEENDWEGIIINLDAPYECKRTKSLIKVKRFFSCDLKCTGIEEGSGRNKGTLGALVCDYKGFPVSVGSGFSDDDRKQFWQHPEEVVGKIISVKYKEETKNKDGGISIQFPVFESVRFDKSESSYN